MIGLLRMLAKINLESRTIRSVGDIDRARRLEWDRGRGLNVTELRNRGSVQKRVNARTRPHLAFGTSRKYRVRRQRL